MLPDLRYALRTLRTHPGLTAAVVLTLALGIGAASTIFSAINTVLLRELPIRDPDRVVRIFAMEPRAGLRDDFSWPEYTDLKQPARAFSGVIAVDALSAGFSIEGNSELVTGEFVSANYFDVLGVRPAVGRGFLPEEELEPGAHPVVVISHGLWQRLADGDSSVVGRTAQVNNSSYTIVGVAPEGFGGTNFALARDVWIPLMMRDRVTGGGATGGLPSMGTDSWHRNRRAHVVQVLGRLGDGVKRGEAARALNQTFGTWAALFPGMYDGVTSRVVAERAGLINPEMPELVTASRLLALTVVGLVLLIVCANVMGLLLARAVAREREIGVRTALGATRARLVQQLLTESVVLAVPAGLLGLLLATWATPIYTAFLPSAVPLAVDFSPDVMVMAFAFLSAIGAAIVFGLVPAAFATRAGITNALHDQRGQVGVRRARTGLIRGVVGAQVALSVVVLMTAGLLIRATLWQQAVDPGYDVAGRVALALDVRVNGYDETAGRQFYAHLLEQVQRLPTVRSASLARSGAFGLPGTTNVLSATQPTEGNTAGVAMGFNIVGPDYFRTLGIPLLAGRDFDTRDRAESPHVAIVNQTFVSRFWPGGDAVGRRIVIDETRGPAEIIGVAADAKYSAIAEAPRPFVYLPLEQHYRAPMTLYVWTGGDERTLVQPIRDVIGQLDRTLPVAGVMTLQEAVDTDLALARTAAVLATSVGALALFLTAVGLYGILAFGVTRRTREIGIRMAVGAQRRDVLWLVIRQGIATVGLAVGVGLTAALYLGGLLEGLFFEISPRDPGTLALVVTVLLGIALLAMYLPARRAARVDPMDALRTD